MTGFTDQTKSKLLETGSHAQIRKPTRHYSTNPRGNAGVFFSEEAENVVEIVKRNGGKALPLLVSPVLLQVREAFNPKVLAAFDPDMDTAGLDLKSVVKQGEYSLGRGEIAVA